MAMIRLVKCALVRNGGSPSEDDIRYIPLNEFGLWEFFMKRKYGWRVDLQSVSCWYDENTYRAELKGYPQDRFEMVTRIFIEWIAGEHLIIPQERYFPVLGYDERKAHFLKHYPASRLVRGREMTTRRLDETPGFFLKAGELPNDGWMTYLTSRQTSA